VASLFSGLPSASAVPPCWDSTTAPVRRFFQDVNYGSTEVSRAVEEARLNQRRVALERQSANLVREYATYNADVSAHIRYNGLRDNQANLYLPMPSGVGDPTSSGLPPSECWVPPSVTANPTGNSARLHRQHTRLNEHRPCKVARGITTTATHRQNRQNDYGCKSRRCNNNSTTMARLPSNSSRIDSHRRTGKCPCTHPPHLNRRN